MPDDGNGRAGTDPVVLARKIVVLVVGGTLLLVGIALLVLPGPAIVVIPLGLGVLALEFAWARRWLQRARSIMRGGTKAEDREPRRPARPKSGPVRPSAGAGEGHRITGPVRAGVGFKEKGSP